MQTYHMSPHRENLRFEGLSAGMPIRKVHQQRRYRVYFLILRPGQRWDLKSKAIIYLSREYEAVDFEFFANRSKPDAGFFCEFTSFAVEGI